MKRAVITMIATALTVAFVPAVADAHSVRFDTDVTVKFDKPDKKDPYSNGSFSGALSSEKARCEKNRTVTVNLQSADGTTSVVGSDATDATGAWSIQPSSAVAPGTYFAETAKKVLRKNSKHRHVCRGGVSRGVKVK